MNHNLTSILGKMLQSPVNSILVEIEKKFQDQNGSIFIDTTWAPEEYATLEGFVVSVPLKINSTHYTKVVGNVKEGDRVFFDYRIVYNYKLQPEDDTPVYKNLILTEGKELWKVDISQVFCVIQDENFLMVTDNVLLEPISDDTGRIKAIGVEMACNVRDVVCFEPKFVQKYNILGSEHYIIPSRKMFAKM